MEAVRKDRTIKVINRIPLQVLKDRNTACEILITLNAVNIKV